MIVSHGGLRSVGVPPTGRLIVDEISGLDTNLATHADVLWYPRWNSWTNMKADWSTWPNSYQDSPTNWPKLTITTAPEYGGISVGRFESHSLTPDTSALSWSPAGVEAIMLMRKYFNENTRQMFTGSTLGTTPYRDLWSRFSIMIESDVWTGLNETGLKLMGFETSMMDPIYRNFATILHHSWPGYPDGTQQYTYPHSYPTDTIKLNTYYYGELGQGVDYLVPPNIPAIITLAPDTWYCFEQHVVMNTQTGGVANSDGLIDTYMNGTLIHSLHDVKLKEYDSRHLTVYGIDDPMEIQQFNGQIYHGGVGHCPAVPIHYRMTGLCVATRRIGPTKTA